MGFLDRLFGRQEPEAPRQPQGRPMPPITPGADDERAIARYAYLLRTAPPERIEQVHAEAFAQLTPEQREHVMRQLSRDLPEGEAPRTDGAQDLARAATRAEMAQPGYLQRSFAGPGAGGMVAGSMLGTVAGFVVGSALAQSMLGGFEQSPEAATVGEDGMAGGEMDSGGDLDSGGDIDSSGDFDFGGFGDF